ncbi:hypothetical protein M1563_02040 [Patescibacteria group bacterium]|nr:hypothetical protein [Patescibacteria group bacterium]MCL5410053.1 hypothetical protein [Patescibacteria group bacterium]
MTDLTDRQRQLLKAIIETYVKTGEPVASEIIEKSCDLGVSPATIRNEMVKLTDLGFLKQPHVSAGRTPTSMGFRLYINELMKERELPIVDEVSIRQQVFDQRAQFSQMVHAATKALAKKCNTLALSVNDDDIYYTGAAHMLDLPEFFDIDVTRFVLSLFDEYSLLEKIINLAQGNDPLHILFGEETGFDFLRPTSFAFLNFETQHGNQGVIGVIGPDRLNFPVVIPYLRYIGEVLQEARRT